MLTGKQKQYLKAAANSIPAIIQIGKEGLTPTVIESIEAAVKARELVKFKINQNSAEEIASAASIVAAELHCEIVQIIGRNCILFRQKEKESRYELP